MNIQKIVTHFKKTHWLTVKRKFKKKIARFVVEYLRVEKVIMEKRHLAHKLKFLADHCFSKSNPFFY